MLITGGSSGLGKYIAESLATKGYRVFAGMRSKKKILLLSKQWRNKSVQPIQLNITSDKDCFDAVEKIVKKEGGIDVLVNNAGYALVGSFENHTSQDFQDILNVNTVGSFRMIKAVFPFMKKRKDGKIINITSLNGVLALPSFAMYCSSKFALEALGLSLKHEVAKYNIHITNLAPGAIQSPDHSQKKEMPHKPAREKFLILKILMPFLTYKKITEKIISIINNSNPPVEVIMGADSLITTSLQRVLPRSVWDKMVSYVWSK